MKGFITLDRKILEWEWYDDINTKVLYLHLLLNARFAGGSWRGNTIGRGQLITGRKSLSRQLKLSEQNIRTSLNRLKSTNEITIKVTNEFSVVTLVNYDKYQSFNTKLTNELTNELTNAQPTINQQLTNDQPQRNNGNNGNNVNNVNKGVKKKSLTDFSKDFDLKIKEVYKLEFKKIKEVQKDFLTHFGITGKKWKDEQDLNEHFLNWFNLKLAKEESKPKIEKVGKRQNYSL